MLERDEFAKGNEVDFVVAQVGVDHYALGFPEPGPQHHVSGLPSHPRKQEQALHVIGDLTAKVGDQFLDVIAEETAHLTEGVTNGRSGKTVELKPGGLHIMLVGLKAPLKAGERFAMKLRFEKAGEVTIDVPVEAVGTPKR